MKRNFDASSIVLFGARHDSNNGKGSTQLFIQRYKDLPDTGKYAVYKCVGGMMKKPCIQGLIYPVKS